MNTRAAQPDDAQRQDQQRLVRLAAVAAAIAVGAIVSSHAARDAVFLSAFSARDLPWVVIPSALLTIGVALATSASQARFGPDRVAPLIFWFNSAALLATTAFLHIRPDIAAATLYFVVVCFGGSLMPAFWSVLNERFDPTAGKAAFATIGWASTAGSILGGLTAERLADMISEDAVLVAVSLGLAITGAILFSMRRSPQPASARSARPEESADSPEDDSTPASRVYLFSIAAFLITVAIGGEIVDYVFKSAASEQWEGDSLLRFFAVFYALMGLISFVGQVTLTKRVLQWAGPSGASTVLPGTVALASISGFLINPLFAGILVKGARSVVNTIFHRASYELFYIPVSTAQKRWAKPLIDVGVVSLGTALGGGVVALLLNVSVDGRGMYIALIVSGLLGLAAVAVVRWAYVPTVTASMKELVRNLSHSDPQLLESRAGGLHTNTIALTQRTQSQTLSGEAAPAEHQGQSDPLLDRLATLRNRDAAEVRSALKRPLPNELITAVIPLLAWDAVARHARAALLAVAHPHTGSLADVLVDPDQPFAVRRRVAQIMAHADPVRARRALIIGLQDPRFEVRYHCGRTLAVLRRDHDLEIRPEQIRAAMLNELEVGRSVWAGRKVLDADTGVDPRLVEKVGARADHSLEHVFNLLACTLPLDEVRAAYAGLQGDDRGTRGTSLEYLQHVLDPKVRNALWPWVRAPLHAPEEPSATDVAEALERSQNDPAPTLAEIESNGSTP